MQTSSKKKEYYRKNRKKIAKQKKLYAIRNKEKIRIRRKKYYQKNKKRLIKLNKANYRKNKKKYDKKKKEYYLKNKDRISIRDKQKYRNLSKRKRNKILKRHRKYYRKNRKKLIKKQTEYTKKNWKRIYERMKQWRKDNKDLFYKRKRAYERKRLKIDPIFRLKKNLNKSVRDSIQGAKSRRTLEYLGVPNINFFKNYISKKLKRGMNWKNYGFKWHLDHIIPVDFFAKNYDLKDFNIQKICMNYKNLQPMEGSENIKKSNKLLISEKKLKSLLKTLFKKKSV